MIAPLIHRWQHRLAHWRRQRRLARIQPTDAEQRRIRAHLVEMNERMTIQEQRLRLLLRERQDG